MTFAAGASASDGAASVFAGSVLAGEGAGVAGSGAFGFGCAGALVVASDSRMREIGGRTVVFFLSSPSGVFFCGCFLSISETLSAAGFGGGFAAGAAGEVVLAGG